MKVIIDVPDNVYVWVKNTGKFGIYRFDTAKAIKNGTPLDEVSRGLRDALKILDNIGKKSEE